MDTNPVTNVAYFFQNTELFVSLNMNLPDAPNVGVPCLFYTDLEAYNQALEMADLSAITTTEPFDINVIGQEQQVLFCLVYIDPKRKASFATTCMCLWLQMEIHDIRYRGINRMAEIKTVSDFYQRLLMQFGIVL